MSILTRILSTTGKPVKHRPANLKNRDSILKEIREHPERFLVAPNTIIDTQAPKFKQFHGKVNSKWAKNLINQGIAQGMTTKQLGKRFLLPRTKPGQPHQPLSAQPQVYALTQTKRGGVEFKTKKPAMTNRFEQGGFVSQKVDVAMIQKLTHMPDAIHAPTLTVHAQAAKMTGAKRIPAMMGFTDGLNWSSLGGWKQMNTYAFWTITGANGHTKADWFPVADGWNIFRETFYQNLWGLSGVSPDDDDSAYNVFMNRWGNSATLQIVFIPKTTVTAAKYQHRLKDSSNGMCVVDALRDQVKPRTLQSVENWIKKNGHPDIEPLIAFLKRIRNINVNVYNQAGYSIHDGANRVNLYLTRKDHIERESPILEPWVLYKNDKIKVVKNTWTHDYTSKRNSMWDEFDACKERKMWIGSPREIKVFWTNNYLYMADDYTRWNVTTDSGDSFAYFLELNNKLEKIDSKDSELFRFMSHSCHYLAQENYEDCEGALGYDVNKMYLAALKKTVVPHTSKLRFGECYHLNIDDVLWHCGCTQIWDVKPITEKSGADRFINSVLYNGAVYPNNFLRIIRKLGFKFTAGITAYSPCAAANKKLILPDDLEETKHYQSLVGRLDYKKTVRNSMWWSVAADMDELRDIQYYSKEQIEIADGLTWGFLPPHYKPEYANHCHVASQILGEAMVLMVNHLTEYDAADLMAIKTDCIFLKSDIRPHNIGTNPGKLKFEKKVNLDFWKTNGFLINPTLKYSDEKLANKSGLVDTDGSNWTFETQGEITPWEIKSKSGHVICVGYAGSGKSYFYETRKDTLITCPTKALAAELKCTTTTHHTAFHLLVPKEDGKMFQAGWTSQKKPHVPLSPYTYVVFDEAHQFGGNWKNIVKMCDDAHACLHVILDVDEQGNPRQLPPVNVKFKMDRMTRAMTRGRRQEPSYRKLGLADIKRQRGELKKFIQKVYQCQHNDKIKEMILREHSDMVITANSPNDMAVSLASVFNPEKDLIIVPYKKNIEFLKEYGMDSHTCHSMIGRTHRSGILYCSLNYFETGMLYTTLGRMAGDGLHSLRFFSL